MDELIELSMSIRALVAEKQFPDALKQFKANYEKFNKEQIANNEFLVADIITCLRRTNQLKKAPEFLKFLSIKINKNTPERILNSYGWVLYDKLKVNFNDQVHNDDEDVITGLIDENYEIIDHIFNENDPLQEEIKILLPLLDNNSKYSPFSKLFSATLKKEKKKQKPNWQFVKELLGIIDVNQLSTNCETFEANVRGQQKTIELASDKETWYAYKTKALLKLGLFQECYELSQKALHSFDRFHYNNNIWFARRIALCKKELGDVDVAIEDLLNINKKKKEWFIQAELSELYFIKENYPEALKYGVMGATNFGDTEYKIGLFLQLGSILEVMKETEKAYEHFLLVKLIREEHKWKLSQSLKDLLDKSKNNYKNEWKDSKSLLEHLQNYWRTLLPDTEKFDNKISKNLKGIIKTIPPGKNFGFITGDNNQEYHFFVDQLRGELNKFERGRKVIFDSKPAKQDGKKPSALNIRLQE